jgi:hypothetical protein
MKELKDGKFQEGEQTREILRRKIKIITKNAVSSTTIKYFGKERATLEHKSGTAQTEAILISRSLLSLLHDHPAQLC